MPQRFDPASTKAKVTLSATYLSRTSVLPPLLHTLRREAPGLAVELITGFSDAADHLLSGRADLALSPVLLQESGLYRAFLFEDPYVCLMDRDNPLARAPMTPDAFAKAPHLIIDYGQRWQPPYHQALRDLGLEMSVAVSTTEPDDVRHLIPQTDLVVAMPARIARQFADALYVCPCPVAAKAELNLYWPARLNMSPLHQWLRGKIEAQAKTA